VALAVNVALSLASVGMVRPAWRWVGVAVLAVGLALRAWGMTTLGASYTRTLRTAGDQRLVQGGPYRLIRHPSYSGSLLVWAGYSLGLGSWIALVVTPGCCSQSTPDGSMRRRACCSAPTESSMPSTAATPSA
jgi:protein-S-isoprenylcysteine O-methyltransferase